jgi:hypothetical protein
LTFEETVVLLCIDRDSNCIQAQRDGNLKKNFYANLNIRQSSTINEQLCYFSILVKKTFVCYSTMPTGQLLVSLYGDKSDLVTWIAVCLRHAKSKTNISVTHKL